MSSSKKLAGKDRRSANTCGSRLATAVASSFAVASLQPMDSVIALMIFGVAGFAAAFSIIPLQSRRERQDRANTAEDDWPQSGFALSRGDFEMCRVRPTTSWTVAEYIFENESRNQFGRYTLLSRYLATITFGDRTATLYIQGSGLNRSSFAGKSVAALATPSSSAPPMPSSPS